MNLRSTIALLALTSLLLASGCGAQDAPNQISGNTQDAEFANAMVEHQRGALERAKAAKQLAERPQVRELAESMARAQGLQINKLDGIAQSLALSGISAPDGPGHTEPKLAHDQPILSDSSDFDRAFIEEMIPHNKAAIKMAKRELDGGENPELRTIARELIKRQTADLAQLERWRTAWYGGK